jgi:hypothetical protein
MEEIKKPGQDTRAELSAPAYQITREMLRRMSRQFEK